MIHSRDEVDSSAQQKNVGVNSAGDAPAFKPGHARRPSNLAPKDLEPISEDCAAKEKVHDSGSDKEDTIKAITVKEVKEVWWLCNSKFQLDCRFGNTNSLFFSLCWSVKDCSYYSDRAC